MKNRWILKSGGDPEIISGLSKELGVDNIIASMLVQRGITTFNEARDFFRPSLQNLHDPFLMKDMDKAVTRLNTAIQNNEKILVYGDYDVDGTTSVAMVYSFLKEFHRNIDFYIPDRYTEGYGISFKSIDFASDNDIDLIVALDCGIKANDKIAFAREKNIDFIICDHHTPGNEIPEAVAVLDPKREDCGYPFKELSGCGVGFKLLQGLTNRNNLNEENLFQLLDLVAVSIASDIVSISGENRILASFGLKKLNENPRTGLKAMIKIAGMESKEIIVSDLVFKIGPRINAAGRIESGRSAVKLLIEEDELFAQELSAKINEHNEKRQSLDKTITEEALEMIKSNEDLQLRKSTVLFNKEWHKGVIGIVASRLIENYYKPTVILTESQGFATGSARSVNGFDLYAAIEHCSDLLESFGGHKHAAGLTLKLGNLENFVNKFEEFVKINITEEQQLPAITIDQKISFAEITPKFFRIVNQFAPFGPGNMTPVYLTENVKNAGLSKIVGKTEEHLRLDLQDEKNYRMQGIAFFMSDYYQLVDKNQSFNICYSIDENEFNGKTSLQLRVRDIHKSS
ncbi:MAG: single-stranded-DNA-specific exonuclease RecJ [Bacteroidales bacterium]